jgi:hypothetical protein
MRQKIFLDSKRNYEQPLVYLMEIPVSIIRRQEKRSLPHSSVQNEAKEEALVVALPPLLPILTI